MVREGDAKCQHGDSTLIVMKRFHPTAAWNDMITVIVVTSSEEIRHSQQAPNDVGSHRDKMLDTLENFLMLVQAC